MHKKFLQTFLAVASLASVAPLAAMNSETNEWSLRQATQKLRIPLAHAASAVYCTNDAETQSSLRILDELGFVSTLGQSDHTSGIRMEVWTDDTEALFAFRGTDNAANGWSDAALYTNICNQFGYQPGIMASAVMKPTRSDMILHPLVTPAKLCLEWADEFWENFDRSIDVHYTGHSLGGFMANTVAELSKKVPTSTIVFNAPGGVQKFIEDDKKFVTGQREKEFWRDTVASIFVSPAKEEHTFRKITINITNDIIGRLGGDDLSRRSLIISGGKGAHSIANLIKDLKKIQ